MSLFPYSCIPMQELHEFPYRLSKIRPTLHSPLTVRMQSVTTLDATVPKERTDYNCTVRDKGHVIRNQIRNRELRSRQEDTDWDLSVVMKTSTIWL